MRLSAKHRVICAVAAMLLAGVAWASSPWKDKKPSDWSAKEMDRFLTNSPWAITVQPAAPPQSLDQGRAQGTGGWGGGPGGGGGGGRGGGGMGGNTGGAAPIVTFQIRWVSAPIMREALKVAESDPLNAAIAKYAGDYYIVSVSMDVEGGSGSGGARGSRGGGQWGAPNGGNGGSGSGPSAAQMQEGRDRFQAMLIQGATLKFNHQQVHPKMAQMVPSKTGMTTIYLFPRDLKLESADKDYVFELTQGPMVTRAHFSLKGFEQAPDKGM